MIEKFCSEKHVNLFKKLPFKYESSEIYLDFAGYIIQRNGEENLAVQDVLYPNDFPYLYLPEKTENWSHSMILWASDGDLSKLKSQVKIDKSFSSGKEFYYKTKDFIDLKGGKWVKFRKDIQHFQNDNEYKLLSDYPETKTKRFLENIWLAEQKEKTASFDESYNFFLFCLDNWKRYQIKTLYVEVDGKLVGLVMGAVFNNSCDKWLALHIKVDYNFRGLSRFLYHQRAKLFSEYSEFTSGATCAGDEGVEKFKSCLHPSRVEESFYVITGDKLK